MDHIKAGKVLAVQCKENGVVLKVFTKFFPLYIGFSFVNGGTIRIQATSHPEDPQTRKQKRAIPLDKTMSDRVLIEENGQVITVSRDGCSIIVNKESSEYTILNKEKEIIRSVIDDETTWFQPLNRPLGCYVTEGNQSPVESIKRMTSAFLMKKQEAFFGLGERFKSFNHRGKRYTLFNENGAGSRNLSYKNIPFFMSSNHYGVYIHQSTPIDVDLGETSSRAWGLEVDGDEMDLYFFLRDSPLQILEEYTKLTGRPPQLPPWSYGLWMTNYFIETSQDSVLEQAQKMRELQIPCDVYHIDTFWLDPDYWNNFQWRESHFPSPESMLKDLHEKGYKVCLWENPYISNMSDLYREGVKKNYFIRNKEGKPYQVKVWRSDMGTLTGLVDFTNPEAKQWYQNIHKELFAMGVDLFKTDFGEEVPQDALWHDGTPGESMHNLYPYLYNEAVNDVTRQEKGYSLVWARSAWAGCQKFPIQWGGDPHASWEDMASSLCGGLSMISSGFSYWSHDIGGFKDHPDKQLYIRWSQFGLFSTHARLHGWSTRNPWDFGEEVVEIFRETCHLRYSLIPYMMSEAKECSERGTPLMRSLYLQFPEDRTTHHIDTQFMLGSSLLVVPVLSPESKVHFYLPAGCDWYDFYTAEKYAGGRWYSETVPLEKIPLFVPDGSILYFTDPKQSIGDTEDFTIHELRVYGEGECAGEFLQPERTTHWEFSGGNVTSNVPLPEKVLLSINGPFEDHRRGFAG